MNNAQLTALVLTPACMLFAWQGSRVSELERNLTVVQRSLAGQAKAIEESSQTLERLHQQTKQGEREIKAFAKPAPAPEGMAITDPKPEELVWENGQSWIWVDKGILHQLNASPIHKHVEFQPDTPELQPSLDALKLLYRYHLQFIGTDATPSPADDLARRDDPIGHFQAWATNQPAEFVEQALGALRRAAEQARNPDQIRPKFAVDPAAASLLGLQADQILAVEQAFKSFANETIELDRLHLEPYTPDAGELKHQLPNVFALRIRSYAPAGLELKDRLSANLAAIMGAERAGYWMAMAEDRFNKDFGNFGQRERELVLSYDGFSYHCTQTQGAFTGTKIVNFGVPSIDAWWHPFVQVTTEGVRASR